MPKQVKVEGRVITVPDDATPDEIDEIFKGQPKANPNEAMLTTARKNLNSPQGGQSGNAISAEPEFHMSDLTSWMNPAAPASPWLKQKLYSLADKATNALPAIGGIGGGMAGVEGGPPGMVAGAAIGGAGGESLRQLARRAIFPSSAPTNSLDAASQIGTEGLKQGAYELGGQGLRLAGKAIAPKLAEAAVAPGKRMLKTLPENVDIGKTILNESSAVSPKKIVAQLNDKIAAHSSEADRVLGQAGANGVKVPLAGTRRVVSDEVPVAVSKNAPAYIRDVNKVGEQLNTQYGANGAASGSLPDFVSPSRARDLRQGIDLSIGNWNPEAQSAIKPLQRRVYGSLTGEIHSAVPDVAAHDTAMTNLIPARDAAWNTSYNPELSGRIIDRLKRPTGALFTAGAGAGAGAVAGGPLGAVIGGTAGLIAPEIASSPQVLMGTARALNTNIPANVIRYATPIGEGQMTKPSAKKLKNERPDDSEE